MTLFDLARSCLNFIKLHGIKNFIKLFHNSLKNSKGQKFNSIEYWENRYLFGGTSGKGSYGKFAQHKIKVINSFIKKNKIRSVIEFGCGDGNVLSLGSYPKYIGLDISETAIRKCKNKFQDDTTKSFFIYNSELFQDNHELFKADLSLSLDVIFHLVNDNIFNEYMKHLFGSSLKYVMIYARDTDNNPSDLKPYMKYRKFSKWIAVNAIGFKMIKRIKTKGLYKVHDKDFIPDFFIYEKI